jgi:Carboxypeptidase regulatory-like domain
MPSMPKNVQSMSNQVRCLLVFVSFLAFSNLLNAQLSTATVTGVVRDASGGVLPNATVVLKNVDTNVERRISTNSAGNYLFLNITPGLYTLETSASGFRPTKVAAFELQVNQTLTQDTALEIGTLEQAVEVAATAETLQIGRGNRAKSRQRPASERQKLYRLAAIDARRRAHQRFTELRRWKFRHAHHLWSGLRIPRDQRAD